VAERKLGEIPDVVVVWFDPNEPTEAYLRRHGAAVGYLILALGACLILGVLVSFLG
jgi:hypothetical protein